MSTNLEIFSLLFIFIVFIAIIYILRKGRITIKYSLIWLFTTIMLFLFILIPSLYDGITKLFGFNVGSNMIFAGLIAMLIFINIALTVIISGHNKKIRLLIQEVSLLKKNER